MENFSDQKFIDRNGAESYLTKEGEVALKWNLLQPKKLEDKNGVVIFLPGVALDSDSKPVLESTQSFADANKTLAYSISTRLDNAEVKNSQEIQANAILKFVQGHRLEKVVIVGNSQGANKAISLVAILEKAGINVEGLILTNPAGLYEQNSKELTKKFFKDALFDTPKTLKGEGSLKDLIFKKETKKAVQLGNSVGYGIAKEVVMSNVGFSKRKDREAEEAATLNENAEKVRTKVVVVFGAKDSAFDSGKFISQSAKEKTVSAQKIRMKALKEVFPNSSDIRVLEAEKLSTHGLHYLRSDEVAETSIHMLKRMERTENTN